MIRAVILDDETKGSSLLEHKINLLEQDIIVEKIYSDPLVALKEIKSLNPDVLFLDVEMPNLNGFQFLEHLAHFSFEVIFVTAYNTYVLDALRVNALDYLLKPVAMDELEKSIEKLKVRLDNKNQFSSQTQKQSDQQSSRIVLHTSEGVYFVKKEEIIKVEAMSNYSVFYLLNNLSKIIVSKTLKEFEVALEQGNFLRVNRSVIVNLDYIIRYKKGDGGVLELVDNSEVEVSSSKKGVLMERLLSI